MTIEKFLSFWSQHNTVIIEGLVALVLLLSLFLAYRTLFGKKSGDEGQVQGLDAAQLEKTLQKILESQSQITKPAPTVTEDLGMDVDLEGDTGHAGTSSADSEELSQLRSSLTDSKSKIELLQKQLQEALAAAEANAAAGAAPVDAAGSQGNEELNNKIRDLESRLAEYEIISEEIADLSRYRNENEDLKKELESLKAGGAVAAPAPAPSAAPASSPAPEPSPVVAETASASVQDDSANLIDDELMKEFAAAVEGQKSMGKVAEKAGDGSEAPKPAGDEAEKLMDEFENFVAKKS